MTPFGLCLFPGVDTPTADGMTRLLSLNRITPASHFCRDVGRPLPHLDHGFPPRSKSTSAPQPLVGQASQPRSLAPFSRNPVFWVFRSTPREEGTRIPNLSKSKFLIFRSYYSTFPLPRQKPSLFLSIRQLRGADPSVVIRPETTHRTLQAVSGVPLEGGQAHRGNDRIRTTFVLTKLTRDGVAHPRAVKELLCFTCILAYPVLCCRSVQCGGRKIGQAGAELAAGAVISAVRPKVF